MDEILRKGYSSFYSSSLITHKYDFAANHQQKGLLGTEQATILSTIYFKNTEQYTGANRIPVKNVVFFFGLSIWWAHTVQLLVKTKYQKIIQEENLCQTQICMIILSCTYEWCQLTYTLTHLKEKY